MRYRTIRPWLAAVMGASIATATFADTTTTSTVTTTTVTTTTTPVAGMFKAVDDGAAALTAQLNAVAGSLRVHTLLERELAHMQTSRMRAEALLNAGRRRQAIVALHNAETWLTAFLSRVRTVGVKKAVGLTTQASMLSMATQVRNNLRAVTVAAKLQR